MKWMFFVILAATTSSNLGIPASLAAYRSWTELTAGPQQLPPGLGVRCLALTEEDRLRIHGCADMATLDRWLDNVLGAATASDMLADGADRARAVAGATMARVRERVGFLPGKG